MQFGLVVGFHALKPGSHIVFADPAGHHLREAGHMPSEPVEPGEPGAVRRGDELLTLDAVFGVKESLVKEFVLQPSGTPTPAGRDWPTAHGRGCASTFCSVRRACELALAPAAYGAGVTGEPPPLPRSR